MTRIVHRLRLMLFILLPLLTAINICYAQKIITGQVVSKSDQSPIAGATVLLKGTKIGTSSGPDGKFFIRAKEGDVLILTGIGITKQEITVGNGDNLLINATTDSRNLNEVVVTATGIKKESKKLAYAIQTVDAATLTQAREANPVNSLKGNAAGLAVDVSSEIGHAPNVVMRGEGSPIFVSDGVAVNYDTYNVNPDDIETFTILKGPNAAALYGFQGKDGAIIINTKKGTRDKRGISINLNSSTQFNKGFIAVPKYQDLYGPGDTG